MFGRRQVPLKPRAVERAHREAIAVASQFRVSVFFKIADRVVGLVFASLLFIVGAWTISTTGPLTQREKAMIGDAYVHLLRSVEMSARELRMAYCGDATCEGNAFAAPPIATQA